MSAAGGSAAGNAAASTFCTGSWGKDFYLQYDVCPLALDELDSYFRAEKCAELIRERFKIFDYNEHGEHMLEDSSQTETLVQESSCGSAAGILTDDGTIRHIDSSCGSPGSSGSSAADKEQQQQHHHHVVFSQDEDDDDDDAGHHSGEFEKQFWKLCGLKNCLNIHKLFFK